MTAASFTPEISAEVQGVAAVRNELGQFTKKVDTKVGTLTHHYAARLAATVRSNAHGAFDVSDYGNRIYVRYRRTRGGLAAFVGSDSPHSIRLEYGFVGRDSLGRFVEQRPRPHFRPALAEIGPQYRDAVAGIFR